jgi:hypothetical protein
MKKSKLLKGHTVLADMKTKSTTQAVISIEVAAFLYAFMGSAIRRT